MLFLFIDKRKVSYLSITLYHLFFAFQMFLIFFKLFVFLFVYLLFIGSFSIHDSNGNLTN